MNFIKKTIKINIIFEGESVVAAVNFDWVNQDVYINSVIYEGTDIKSILSDISEENLEKRLAAYCVLNG